jgi:uncharacterized protein (DUF2062 family)
VTFVARQWSRLKNLWHLAKNERASPRQIAWAVAVGAFSGCTPAPGFHGWIAIGLATVLRLNRLFAWLGSRISFFAVYPWIVIAEVELAHRVRTGSWVEISRETAVEHAGTLMLDWCLGSVPVGLALGGLCGLLGYAWAARRKRRGEAPDSPEATEAKPE